MPARVSSLVRWQIGLLLPFPPLSLLYLLAVRAERLAPGFGVLLGLMLLPLASLVVGVFAVRGRRAGLRTQVVLLAIAVAELVWAVLALAMAGFAVAWHSG